MLVSMQVFLASLMCESVFPISLSISNRYERATYKFCVRTPGVNGGVLEVRIVFPPEYEVGLGLGGTAICSGDCGVGGRTVFFNVMGGEETERELWVDNVLNPSKQGGTGHFAVMVLRGDRLLKEQLNFGVVGISASVGLLETAGVSLAQDANDVAGQLTEFEFEFAPQGSLPSGVFYRLQFPKGVFGFAKSPPCKSIRVGSSRLSGTAVCVLNTENKVWDFVDVYELSGTVPGGTSVGISVSAINPGFQTSTGSFGLSVVRLNTNMMYERNENIPALSIIQGSFTQVSFTPVNSYLSVTMNKLMWFRLTFFPSNFLESGSVVRVTFPPTLDAQPYQLLGYSTAFLLERGLEDPDPISKVQLTFSAALSTVTLSNFKPKRNLDAISLLLMLKTPANPGDSSPILIESYTAANLGALIDRDNRFAKVSVANVPSPSNSWAVLSNSFASSSRVLLARLSLFYTPLITLPASGFISVTFPPEMIVGKLTSGSCQVQNSPLTTDIIDAPGCFKSSRSVFVKISTAFFSGTAYQIQLANSVYLPSVAGNYLVDVVTYMPDQVTPIESYTQLLSISAPQLLSPSIELIPAVQAQKSLLRVAFTLPTDLSPSKLQDFAGDKISFFMIFVQPDGAFVFDSTLGLGVTSGSDIPCYAGKELKASNWNFNYPVPSHSSTSVADQVVYRSYASLNCSLIIEGNPAIKVQNYAGLAKGGIVEILVPGLTNLNGPTKITVQAYSLENRKLLISAEFVQSIQLTVFTAPTYSFDYSSQNQALFYTFSSMYVGTNFTFSMNLNLLTQISASSKVVFELPKGADGFCKFASIGCSIQDYPYDCICTSNYILITLGPYDLVAAANAVLKITQLSWPSEITTLLGTVKVRVVNSNGLISQLYTYPMFPAYQPLSLVNNLVDFSLKIGAVDDCYKFVFTVPKTMLVSWNFYIEFPTIFNLVYSALPVRVVFLTKPDIFNQTTFYVSNNKVNINGIPPIMVGDTFTFWLFGVQTPSTILPLTGFLAKMLSANNNLVSLSSNFFNVTMQNYYTPQKMTLLAFFASNLNANTLANYHFALSIPSQASKNSLLQFDFPSQFTNIGSEVSCQISGGISFFSSFSVSSSTAAITLGEDYLPSNQPVFITLFNVKNPDQGPTGGITIATYYDSVLTGSMASGAPSLTIIAPPLQLSSTLLSLSPQNEAELTVLDSQLGLNTNISSTDAIVFIFSPHFNPNMDKISCSSLQGLSEATQCEVRERSIILTELGTYFTSELNPIRVRIKNIVLPNTSSDIYSNSPSISVAVATYSRLMFLSHEDFEQLDFSVELNPPPALAFREYLSSAITFTTTSAPSILLLNSMDFSNTHCRMKASIALNLTLVNAVPSSSYGGSIALELPSVFPKSTGTKKVVADSSFANYASAQSSDLQIKVTGNSQDFSGTTRLQILGVDNPTDEIFASDFVLRTQDDINKKVISRTYQNISPANFSFSYPGPLIKINNEETITVYAGTVSPPIPIIMNSEAQMNLTIFTSLEGVFIIPEQIVIPIGSSKSSFRISVPQYFAEGIYTLTWKFLDVMYPLFYTPIKSQSLKVAKQIFAISVTALDYIEFGGKSLPIIFSLEAAPDTSVVLTLNKMKDYQGISLNTSSLQFNSSVTSLSFTISYTDIELATSENLQQGSIAIQIAGINSDIFNLTVSEYNFKVTPQSNTPPSILSFSLTDVEKTNATFSISTSKPCYLYYFVGLKGSTAPTINQIKSKSISDKVYVFQVFGEQYLYLNNSTSLSFTVQKLWANFDYQIFIYVEDLSLNVNGPYNITFSTLNRDKSADVSIRLKQTFLTSWDIFDIRNYIAELLCVPVDKILEQKYLFGSAKISSSSTSPSPPSAVVTVSQIQPAMKTLFLFSIVSSPDNEDLPSPKTLGLSLNSKIKMLAARIKNFDSDYLIPSTEFESYSPKFVGDPLVKSFTYEKVTIGVTLDNYSWVYAVAIPSSEGLAVPTRVQISLGLDSANIKRSSSIIEISDYYIEFIFSIEQLDETTEYIVYLIGANSQPGYPELMDDDQIKSFTFTTLKAPAKDFLDLGASLIPVIISISLLLAII